MILLVQCMKDSAMQPLLQRCVCILCLRYCMQKPALRVMAVLFAVAGCQNDCNAALQANTRLPLAQKL